MFSEFEPALIKFTTYQDNCTTDIQTITPTKLDGSETTMHRIAGIKLINELATKEKSRAEKPKASRISDMVVETDDDVSIKQEIVNVSTDLNVLSSYTAFIGVENKVDKVTGEMALREVPLQRAQNAYRSYGGEGCCLKSCSLSAAPAAMTSYSTRSSSKSLSCAAPRSVMTESFSSSNSRSSSSFNECRSSSPVRSTTTTTVPIPTFVVTQFINSVRLGKLLTSTKNESLMNLLIALCGLNIPTLKVGDIIQLTNEGSNNGYYEIVDLGSDDAPWVLQSVN